ALLLPDRQRSVTLSSPALQGLHGRARAASGLPEYRPAAVFLAAPAAATPQIHRPAAARLAPGPHRQSAVYCYSLRRLVPDPTSIPGSRLPPRLVCLVFL